MNIWPRNAAKFGLVPVVSGIRSGTSSDASSGGAPTVPDGGICSAGSEYGLVGVDLAAGAGPLVVMPTVVNRPAGTDAEVVELRRDRRHGVAAQRHRAEVAGAEIGDVADLPTSVQVVPLVEYCAVAVPPWPASQVEGGERGGDADVERRVELVGAVLDADELDLAVVAPVRTSTTLIQFAGSL